MRSGRGAAYAVLLVALGVSAAPPAGAQAPGGSEVTLTEADSGRTVNVARGDRVRITLVPPSGDRWTAPVARSDGSTRVGVFRAGLRLDETVTDAFFDARTASTNQISSVTDAPCFHSAPACARPTKAFSVTVVVADGPRPGAALAPPALERRPVDKAIELTRNNVGGIFSIEAGEAVHVKSDLGPFTTFHPSGLFIERWLVDAQASDIVLRGVSRAYGEVSIQPDPSCSYEDPQCLMAIPLTTWKVSVGPPGSRPEVVQTALDHTVVTAGNTPVLTTRLLRSDGSPAFGAADLYEKAYGEAAYRGIGVAQTRDDGTLTKVLRPLAQTAYVAVVTTTAGRLSSVATTVRVHTRVIISSYNTEANGGFVIRGRIILGGPSMTVGLAQVDGGWRYLSSGPAASDFTYTLRYPLPFGDHVYDIFTSARGGNLRGSARLRLSRLR